MEQTVVIIKPDGVKRKLVGQIIQRFEQKQVTIKQLNVAMMTRQLAEEHYAHIRKYDFFEDMIQYMTRSVVVFALLEGTDVINVVRKLVGATNCLEAEPGTIRGDFGGAGYENIIHASDSTEASKIEIARFFKKNS